LSAKPTSCPFCSSDLESGHLYVRGIGASLFWSRHGDTRLLSRKHLEQIDLSNISTTYVGGQAVIGAWRCTGCDLVCFRLT